MKLDDGKLTPIDDSGKHFIMEFPFPQVEIVDIVSEQDRMYFVNHPEEDNYVREMIKGELIEDQKQMPYIHVIKGEGMRIRYPIQHPSQLYDHAKELGFSVKGYVAITHPQHRDLLYGKRAK